MKATLLLATLSVALASPSAFAAKDNAKPAPAAEKSKSQSASSYTVKAGDSFAKIARTLGTTADNLAKANGLTTDSVIRPGQNLKVPAKSAAPAKPQSAPTVKSTDKTHQVQAGETFSSIARKHGISSAVLAAANPTAVPTSLRPGQILNLADSSPTKPSKAEPDITAKATPPVKAAIPAETPPVSHPVAKSPAPAAPSDVPRETKPVAEASKPPTPEPSASTPTAAPAASGQKYITATVDSETTLGEFAAKHGADAKRLNELNGLDLTTETVLAKGSELIVPVQP